MFRHQGASSGSLTRRKDRESNTYCKYLRFFVVIQLPADGSLLPKHIGVGT